MKNGVNYIHVAIDAFQYNSIQDDFNPITIYWIWHIDVAKPLVKLVSIYGQTGYLKSKYNIIFEMSPVMTTPYLLYRLTH